MSCLSNPEGLAINCGRESSTIRHVQSQIVLPQPNIHRNRGIVKCEGGNKVRVMEARKEKREEVEKKEEVKGGWKKKSNKEEGERKGETVIRRVIREWIVSDGAKERAERPDDVLAFSRSVRNVDSYLE